MSTWINDLIASILNSISILPQAIAATVNGTAIDCQGVEGPLVAEVWAGTLTDGGYTPSVEESDTSGGTFTAITPLDGAWVEITAANDEQVHARKFKRTKRFCRIVITESTAGVTGVVAGAAIKGMLKVVP